MDHLWGQTFNQLIQTATALLLASEDTNGGTTVVGLSPVLTTFYVGWLDPRDDILPELHAGPCDTERTLQDYFFLHRGYHAIVSHLQGLVPQGLDSRRGRTTGAGELRCEVVVLVFPERRRQRSTRRNLEGVCVNQAERLESIVCPNYNVRQTMNVSEFANACNMENTA